MRLYSPSEAHRLFPFQDPFLRNTSQVRQLKTMVTRSHGCNVLQQIAVREGRPQGCHRLAGALVMQDWEVCAQVDVLGPHPEQFRDFEKVPYLQCQLEPGQVLFIPRKWWHFVQSLSGSLSVSYWWTDGST